MYVYLCMYVYYYLYISIRLYALFPLILPSFFFFFFYLFIKIHNLSNLDIWWNFLTVKLACWWLPPAGYHPRVS